MAGRLKPLGVALAAGLALAVAGCDLQEDADTENGRQLFSDNCGRCHILKEAASIGMIGPSLDASFADARASGMDEDTIEGIVEAQIANPRQTRDTQPNSPTFMPADLVTGDDARDVAAYVASVAGVPGIEPPEVPGGPGGQVFAQQGCGSCHVLQAADSSGTIGPDLDEVLPDQSAQEIEESIVDPRAMIAQGFEGDAEAMPDNYGEMIPQEQLQELVRFLQKEAGRGGGGGGGSGGGG